MFDDIELYSPTLVDFLESPMRLNPQLSVEHNGLHHFVSLKGK